MMPRPTSIGDSFETSLNGIQGGRCPKNCRKSLLRHRSYRARLLHLSCIPQSAPRPVCLRERRRTCAYVRFWKAPPANSTPTSFARPSSVATFATSLFKGQLYGGSTARRLHRVPAYSTMKEAVALVDAAFSYLTRMAFRSSLSGDVPNMARDFSCPGRPFPRERCNSFWSKPMG